MSAAPTVSRVRGPAFDQPRFWVLATTVTLIIVSLLPLFWDARFYFHGDTQIAYTGWWYHLGEQVRQGHLPLLDPVRWESGNYVAEGQWGLFSPLTIAIGLAATVAPNLVVFATVLKIGLLLCGGVGAFVLIRSYDVVPPAAYIGGILVGLGGQSVFYDWPSWITGQMATALLPWAWWLTRRAMRGQLNPLPALIVCYLVVTIGYVYSGLYLAIILFGCLVEAAVARDRPGLLRALGIGVVSGLVMITVYLPGVLTSPVTIRDGWEVIGTGRRTVDVDQILTSVIPATKQFYLAWCLPILAWISWPRARLLLKELAGVIVISVVLLVWVLGPSALGPLRWPIRVLPALMVALTVLLVVMVARSVRLPITRTQLTASLVWVAAAAYLIIVRQWDLRGQAVAGAVIVAAGLLAVTWALRRSVRGAAFVMGLWTLIAFTFQLAISPNLEAADRHMPAAADRYRGQIPKATGDVMVIGTSPGAVIGEPTIADELLVGSSWNLNPQAVQNGYSTISFRTFTRQFCRTFNGGTCPQSLAAVLKREPTTGRRWVDLLSVSTLVMFRPDFSDDVLMDPPEGWRVVDTTRWAVTWTREVPVPTAGGVVWTSPGTTVTELDGDSQTVRLRVDEMPANGGTVVLSRLAWPGYEVAGATLADPLREMLVQVTLDPASAGQTVTVHWDPPGWQVELLTWRLAIGAGLIWSGVVAVVWFRRRREDEVRSARGTRPDDRATTASPSRE